MFVLLFNWTRLIDDLEKNTVNQDAVDFYNDVIDCFIENGIRPIMNLHHFDLPVELYHKYGGWESRHVVDLYVGFAEQAFKLSVTASKTGQLTTNQWLLSTVNTSINSTIQN